MKTNNASINLDYVGMAGMNEEIPMYKDQNGITWVDMNAEDEQNPQFRKFEMFMDDYDDWQTVLEKKETISERYPHAEIKIISDFERDPGMKFNYSLLGRFQADVEYFLGFGCGSLNMLYGNSIDTHIREMEELHNSFPPNKKPAWLTLDEIKEYKKRMETGLSACSF